MNERRKKNIYVCENIIDTQVLLVKKPQRRKIKMYQSTLEDEEKEEEEEGTGND